MKNVNVVKRLYIVILCFVGVLCFGDSIENSDIRAEFYPSYGIKQVSRKDGSDALKFTSDDVFEIVLFDKKRFTANDYNVIDISKADNSLKVLYKVKENVDSSAPSKVEVSYKLGKGPWLFKDINLKMKEGDKIDRLSVLRFSSDKKALRGGHGQPVFIDDWFFGLNYPCFYSRHSDGFVEPKFHYAWHYTINLEDGDAEYSPEKGGVSLFHFPGYAKKTNSSWDIKGKQGVIGISSKKNDGAELGLLDYIESNRKPTRSYLHFNNWYTPEAKEITVDAFVNKVALKIKNNLGKYGAKLDAMVPDDRWQKRVDFNKIYEPVYPMNDVSKALRAMDIDFGVWLAIDGTSNKAKWGERVGYKMANEGDKQKRKDGKMMTVYEPSYQEKVRFWGPQPYYNILDEKYQKDLKDALRYLLKECDVRYFKHDFNHMFTSGYLSERHAREACLDVTLDIIAYERELKPNVLINYTNGTFFTPFFLLFAEYIWMNSGDNGTCVGAPQLCRLEDATSYRDSHFYLSFNNEKEVVRPIIPIANFMTHGILHSKNVKYFDVNTDTIQDWLNYIVFYYARGTLLKELYISPDDLNEDMWKALGTASAWAQTNQDRLKNTILVGGNPSQGEVYGYISWNGDKGILSVRNPNRETQILKVPFDKKVYYRGELGKRFHARAIYPYVEEMPWKITSGEAFEVPVAGDSVIVYEIDLGEPKSNGIKTPKPLPNIVSAKRDKDNFEAVIEVPDEDFPRYELILYHGYIGKKKPEVPTVDGKPINMARRSLTPPRRSPREIITSYDLRKYRGKKIHLACATPHKDEAITEAWLIVDRNVESKKPIANGKKEVLPWSIGEGYRRITQCVVEPDKTLSQPQDPIKK